MSNRKFGSPSSRVEMGNLLSRQSDKCIRPACPECLKLTSAIVASNIAYIPTPFPDYTTVRRRLQIVRITPDNRNPEAIWYTALRCVSPPLNPTSSPAVCSEVISIDVAPRVQFSKTGTRYVTTVAMPFSLAPDVSWWY